MHSHMHHPALKRLFCGIPVDDGPNEAPVAPRQLFGTALHAGVSVELFAQVAVFGRVPADDVQEAVRMLEHVHDVGLELGRAGRVPSHDGPAVAVELVEKLEVDVIDVKVPLLEEVLDSVVETIGSR